MKEAAEFIISLGHDLAEERDRAFDLWTHLPSYRAAQAAHGDYASEFRPSVADVMREATRFIAHKLAPTSKQIEEAGDLYRCPCGEDHS